MNETQEMRTARHELQRLSASDPAAAANMMRHVVAFSLMFTGRRQRERQNGEPQIAAGFVLSHGNQNLCAAAARRSKTDQIYIAFDVDDARAAPLATGVFREQDGDMWCYGNCRLWAPACGGRALLVPRGDDYLGYFAFQPGHRLKLVQAPVPGDLDAGTRRADARLRHLLASDTLRNVHCEGFMHLVRNVGAAIFADTSRLAA